MKKILSILALASVLAAPTAQAHGYGHHGHGHGGGNWFGPMLGGMIIGGVVVDAMRPRETVIIQQQPPVVIQQQPNYQIVPQQPQCRYENAFSSNGQYLGQIPVCN